MLTLGRLFYVGHWAVCFMLALGRLFYVDIGRLFYVDIGPFVLAC